MSLQHSYQALAEQEWIDIPQVGYKDARFMGTGCRFNDAKALLDSCR